MKMNKRFFAAGLLGSLLLVPQGAFAAGFANTAQSATSTGLGGVGAANPDEPNSSYYNPAAMTQRDSFNVYLGPTLIAPNVKYDGPGDEVDTATEGGILPPPNFHLAVPFGNGMAAGVGVVFPYGLTIEWPDTWAGREIIRRQRLQTIDINPNFAYEIGDTGLSVAAGAQFILASVELERTTILREDTEVDAHIGGDGVGYGGTAAVLYQPIESLTFGLNFRSGAKLNFKEGEAHFDGEEGTPFEGTFVDQMGSTSINLPHAFTAGVSYSVGDLFLEFDAGYTMWSAYDKIELEFSRPCEEGDQGCEPGVDTNPPTTTIQSDWQDSATFRLGVQYNIMEKLPIRIGAAYDMTPIPEETVAPSLPGNDRAVFSIGTGYTIAGFRGDIAYMLVTTSRDIDNGNQDGTYNTTANIVGINVGYGF